MMAAKVGFQGRWLGQGKKARQLWMATFTTMDGRQGQQGQEAPQGRGAGKRAREGGFYKTL